MNTTFVIPGIVILLAALLVLAFAVMFPVILIRSGKRGRLVNDHPICRACGFDLFNLPSDRTKCPECGADITKPKAVLPGLREPFMGRIWLGRLWLGILAIILAVNGWDLVTHENATRFKPAAWLSLETRYASSPTQRRAWQELARRASVDSLSDGSISSLVDAALDLQEDVARPWITDAGRFIENARKQGHVTDAQWTRYAKQAQQLTFVVRQQVGRASKTLPAETRFAPARAADNSKLVLRSEEALATGDCIRVLPEWQRGRGSSGFTLSSGGTGSHGYYIQLDPKVLPTTQPGKRTVTVEIPMRITEGWEDDAAEIYSETRTFQADWELVDGDQPEIALLPDDSPEIRKQVENAISIESIKFQPSNSGDRLDVNIMANFLPVPVAYRVSVRSGERTWDGLNFRTLPTSGRSQLSSSFAVKDFDAERVDVIFEPSPDAALETVHMTQLWNGRLVIKGVPVQRDPFKPTSR